MKLVYDFTQAEFVDRCRQNVVRSETTLFEDIYQALCFFLNSPIDPDKRITKVKHRYSHEHYDPNLSLADYIQNGFIEFYYPEMDCYSAKDDVLEVSEVLLPSFITLVNIKYGSGVTRAIKVKQRELKTMSKVAIQLIHVKVYAPTLRLMLDTGLREQDSLLPSKLGVWEWRQTFYNKLSGQPRFCTCFKSAISKDKDNIVNEHPHVAQALKESTYEDGICHLCTQTNSDLFFCHPMYGSAFMVKYGAYVRKFAIENDLDERSAENCVRDIKGIPRVGEKWINETLLYKYVDSLFSDLEVQREASPPWLGRQRLDIYIPELELAIEYQGQQHFQAVDFFGGQKALQKNKQRDYIKAQKCRDHNVALVYFSYKDDLSKKLVVKRLKKYLERSGGVGNAQPSIR